MKDRVRVRIDATISKFVHGLGWQYTSDIEPFFVDAEVLDDRILFQKVIDDFCRDWASNTIPYDVNAEDYVLRFYRDDKKISEVLLSNYSRFFGCSIDDAEIAD